jgi:DUF971 family protein
MTYELKSTPVDLAKADEGHIAITWGDGKTIVYAMDFLRSRCPCASCVDEWTGAVRIRYEDVVGVKIKKMEQVGNYAFSILFSDGHGTGFFTYEKLRQWGDEIG